MLIRKSLTDHQEKKFACVHCEKSFGRQKALQLHLATHSVSLAFQRTSFFSAPHCPTDQIQSRRNSNVLNFHCLSCYLQEEKPFQCELCPKSYALKQHLNNHHVRSHAVRVLCSFPSLINVG